MIRIIAKLFAVTIVLTAFLHVAPVFAGSPAVWVSSTGVDTNPCTAGQPCATFLAAVVKLGGRYFVISVSTGKFLCDGNELMGISTEAPIYAELEGRRAGDAISFNGRELVIEEVA